MAVQRHPSATHAAVQALLVAAAGTLFATPAIARQASSDLTQIAVEDLMKVTITSASRRPESAFDAAAAVYVITQDEIRHSGLTSVPELLRLAPGVQVARIDSNKWAIGIRGFNFRWSNKLLVMIDGRTIYNRVQSGVFWEMVDMPVELVDRIEVVRGPGGSLWGANAVNGVINIITKSAVATRGRTLRAGGGALGQFNGFAQSSAAAGKADYRVFGQWFDRGHALLPNDRTDAGDRTRSGTGGFRMDWTGVSDDVALSADISAGRHRTPVAGPTSPFPPTGGWPIDTHVTNWRTASVLARWTHGFSGRTSVEVLGSLDRLHRDEVDGISDHATTADAAVTFRGRWARHSLVGGAEYRETHERVPGAFGFSVTPENETLRTFNLFAQDELSLDRVRLTFGTKVEHDTLGGWSVQPTVRALWQLDDRQRLWTAVSRAVRTPARVDRGMSVNAAAFIGPQGLPVLVGLRGNPNYESENLNGFEAGYRIDVGPALSIDVAGFLSHYEGLQSLNPQAPTYTVADDGRPYIQILRLFGNDQNANTRGVETTAYWRPAPSAVFQGSVSLFHVTPHPLAGTTDPDLASADGNAPGHQWQLRGTWSPVSRLALDVQVFGVGRLRARAVPGYTRADVRVDCTLTGQWSVSVTGQNLFGAGHVEFGGDDNGTTPNLQSRSASGQLVWRF